MPRLTNYDYIVTHHVLATYWQRHEFVFATLTPNEQWALHGYFVPYRQGLSVEELLEHRRAVTKQQPTLPQRAGRALSQFRQNDNTLAARSASGVKADTGVAIPTGGGRALPTVYALVNPEIDVQKVARALIAMVEWERKRKKKG